MTRSLVQGYAVSTRCPWELGPCPRARDVDQHSQANSAHVVGDTVSTSCPGLPRSRSEVLRCRPPLPGDSGSCPMTSYPRGLVPGSDGPRGRPYIPGYSCGDTGASGVVYSPGRLGLISKDPREVDHQSRVTPARVRWSTVSTSCPSFLGPCSDNPRGRTALPSDLHSSPRAHGIQQHSQASCAPVDGPHC